MRTGVGWMSTFHVDPTQLNAYSDLIGQFADDVAHNFSLPVSAQPEDQLKSPVGQLLSAVGTLTDLDVNWRTEVHPDDVEGRPDIGVVIDGLLNGHVELKRPGNIPRDLQAVSATDFPFSGSSYHFCYHSGSSRYHFQTSLLLRLHRSIPSFFIAPFFSETFAEVDELTARRKRRRWKVHRRLCGDPGCRVQLTGEAEHRAHGNRGVRRSDDFRRRASQPLGSGTFGHGARSALP